MLNRRTLLAGMAATTIAPRISRAQNLRDATGRELKIPANVKRVFPAGPPAAIMLYSVAPELLLGWPRALRKEEAEFLLPEIASRPELGRITGRGNTANLESVLALKPDMILDVGSTSQTYVSLAERVQEQTGIPYVLLDGRFDAIHTSYRTLGELIRRREDANVRADYAEKTFESVLKRIADVPQEKRPKVYYARSPRGLETGLGGSINVESIEMMAQNVAGTTRGGMANVSIEQVLLWNPDAIVTIEPEFAKNAKTDPAWANVSAVKNGRVYLSPRVPFGWVDFPPSVNRLIGLWWLGKILYPEKFPKDIAALAREFHKLIYHVTPTEAQIARVLSGQV
ncbi:MAG TPA: iron ABC transporter substrate-binding protein [Xanthobacteraceae bacterium]|nr:iron ABC transporter substrate-binding protein [Xanthobacteraceae bacterium]